LIVFPRKAGKAKKGDAEASELSSATQLTGALFPVTQAWGKEKARKVTEAEKNTSAYEQLRKARSIARLAGIREARRKAKEEEEANKKK
ncbi:60S ribosomal protein L13, partial [Mortierella sp. AD010]